LPPTSSTTKTGRHDIAEILLKVALNPKKSIEKNQCFLEVNKQQWWFPLQKKKTCF
jgi:hypothetical protein